MTSIKKSVLHRNINLVLPKFKHKPTHTLNCILKCLNTCKPK